MLSKALRISRPKLNSSPSGLRRRQSGNGFGHRVRARDVQPISLPKKVETYRDKDTKSGKPRNEALVARIEDVRLGAVRSLFTDDMALFPAAGRQAWWEVWVRDGRLETLRHVAQRLNVTLKEHAISFPERDVVLALANEEAMARLVDNSDAVAELRIAKDTPTLFLEMRPVEQADWAANLVDRVDAPDAVAPAICLLDSGATRTHPLIEPGLDAVDQHAYDNGWGVGDSAYWNGHGTSMSGVALYGDLEVALSHGGQVELRHRLETVKILPPAGQNDPELYGAITEVGIKKAGGASSTSSARVLYGGDERSRSWSRSPIFLVSGHRPALLRRWRSSASHGTRCGESAR